MASFEGIIAPVRNTQRLARPSPAHIPEINPRGNRARRRAPIVKNPNRRAGEPPVLILSKLQRCRDRADHASAARDIGVNRAVRQILDAAAEDVEALKLEIDRLADEIGGERISRRRAVEPRERRRRGMRRRRRAVHAARKAGEIVFIGRCQRRAGEAEEFAVDQTKRLPGLRRRLCRRRQRAGAFRQIDAQRIRRVIARRQWQRRGQKTLAQRRGDRRDFLEGEIVERSPDQRAAPIGIGGAA